MQYLLLLSLLFSLKAYSAGLFTCSNKANGPYAIHEAKIEWGTV